MEETMWKKLMKLNSSDVLDQLSLYYGNFLPMEVRCHLADWIENTIFSILCVDPESSDYEFMAKKFKSDLITQMISRSQQMVSDNMIPTKARFDEAIKRYLVSDAIHLVSTIAEVIRKECQLLSDFQYGNYANYVSESREIDHRIENLKATLSVFQANDVAQWTKSYTDYLEEYFVVNGNNSPLNNVSNGGSPAHPIEINLHTSSLSYLLEILKQLQSILNEKLVTIMTDCQGVINNVIEDFIKQWKSNQYKYGNNDFSINGANADKLNVWCSELGKTLADLYETINSLQENLKHLPNMTDNNFASMLVSQGQISLNLLMKLIRESLIVEHQPSQVIKTNTRFVASIRLLIGDAFNNKIVNAVSRATIVSEAQAKNINKTNVELSCGEIANNQVNLEVKGNSCTGYFRNMILKNFKRTGKKSCEMVTDEKFALVFTVTMDVYGRKLIERVMSLPIVVTVHGSQEMNAWATILWDNAFARTNREYFTVAETITWKEFSEALSYKYHSVTGRGLTDENLHFLAEKLYDQRVPFPVPPDNFVTWSAFCKDKLSLREFTFWEWFYACLKLTKDNLKSSWCEGRIVGFIDKKKCEEKLLISPHGTFILRFSDSELGALSIAWLNAQELDENKNPTVLHIRPINSKEFEIINIHQRISDVDELRYLYPNIPKSEAFRMDSNHNSPGDYVSFRTVMRVDIKRK